MSNIRVRAAIERIQTELNQLGEHIISYSGIEKKDAFAVDNAATDIATTAAQIAELARAARGTSTKPGTLVRQTRRALGFTVP
jgi:hypothetical protein